MKFGSNHLFLWLTVAAALCAAWMQRQQHRSEVKLLEAQLVVAHEKVRLLQRISELEKQQEQLERGIWSKGCFSEDGSSVAEPKNDLIE